MGIADTFGRDDRFEIKTKEFIDMVQAGADAEAENRLFKNAVSCDVPHKYIREMISGTKEGPEVSLIQTTPALVGTVTKTPDTFEEESQEDEVD